MASTTSAVIKISPLGFPFSTPDPFLFCVYHADDYPQGAPSHMRAPTRGNGADFDWTKPYRMYHGETIPGFPSHPHRGFETLTITLEGLVDHADSLGARGRYGEGDLQWMNAGSGVVHQELFPLIKTSRPNTLRLYQIWLNLPGKDKMKKADYVMTWRENLQHVAGEGGAIALVYAGVLRGVRGGTPPTNSWAAADENDVGVFVLQLPPGSSFSLPAARDGVSRRAFVTRGDGVRIGDEEATPPTATVELSSEMEVSFSVPSSGSAAEVLILQGRPIGEPVAQRGPFVMNTQAELAQAFADYRTTGFGHWPYEEEEVVFERTRGRFAARRSDGGAEVVELPPGGGAIEV